jgi:hypothetical protein
LNSLPFPSSEYQGPVIGVPNTAPYYYLMKSLQGTYYGDALNAARIRVYGWVDVSGNLSTSRHSNFPTAYVIVPNKMELDQSILRFERLPDTVQTDHLDWGFRVTQLYGIDYRYTVAQGYFSSQLLNHNRLYGYDPVEMYFDLYVPWVAQGMTVRIGRYISPPDIEAQLAPDNYVATHSLLYAYDAYTQTGILVSVKLNKQWTVQGGIYGGNDVAPWTDPSVPTGYAGVRWVSADNNDSVFTCLNTLNDAHFRSGHDNFNYAVSTWTHRFTPRLFTMTEAYYMWQFHALTGGTVNNGPVQSFGGGGGPGTPIPGNAAAYGAVNYTELQLSDRDYVTVRNEYWNDTRGERTGFATAYTSHTLGYCHHFSEWLQVRPEVAYWRSDHPSFDNGTRRNQFTATFDVILRF